MLDAGRFNEMKPYYDDGKGIVIYHGDCKDILPTLPKVDLVLTDPPYNVGIACGDGFYDQRKDYAEWCSSWFFTLVAKSDLIALTPGIVNVHIWTAIARPKWIVAWIKPAAMGRSPMGFCNWEPVLIWGKPQHQKGVDVITAPIIPDGEVDGHPCPKPIKWASGLIHQLTDHGSILDPFMGSGTTLRTAKDLGRKCIGIEIEERYCEIAAQRLSQEVLALA